MLSQTTILTFLIEIAINFYLKKRKKKKAGEVLLNFCTLKRIKERNGDGSWFDHKLGGCLSLVHLVESNQDREPKFIGAKHQEYFLLSKIF